MKIVQITPVKIGEFTTFFGLAEDNKVYSYSYVNASWKPYKKVAQKVTK